MQKDETKCRWISPHKAYIFLKYKKVVKFNLDQKLKRLLVKIKL